MLGTSTTMFVLAFAVSYIRRLESQDGAYMGSGFVVAFNLRRSARGPGFDDRPRQDAGRARGVLRHLE